MPTPKKTTRTKKASRSAGTTKTERTKKVKKTSSKVSRKAPAKAAAKAAAKRSAQPESVPQEQPLSAAEIDVYRNSLLERRQEILGDVDSMSVGTLRNNQHDASGDLSNMPIHMADIGTDNYEQEFTLGLIESERNALREIDRALIKIKEGRYGICEGTGEVINRTRLQARPEARYCIEFARLLEKGEASPPENNNFSRHGDNGEDEDAG